MLPVFEDKKWIAVLPRSGRSTAIPIEALVPGDAKTDNCRTLPYLMQQYRGRAAADFEPRARAPEPPQSAMGPEPLRRGRLGRARPAAGLPFAQAFDPKVTAETPIGPSAPGVFKLGEVVPGGSRVRARQAAAHHGLRPRRRRQPRSRWAPPTPAVVCLLDPPSVEGRRPNIVFRWMIRGVRGVIAPKGPIEKPVADALIDRHAQVVRAGRREPDRGADDGEARAPDDRGQAPAPGLTDAHYHPVQWTQMQAWLVIP